MSNKITYEYDCYTENKLTIQEAINSAINKTFEKYGSNWFEKAAEDLNIIEIKIYTNTSEYFSIIVQSIEGSGVIKT